ncbi:MAG: TonB family protein [Bdellovibrionales bacterium]
MLASCKAFLIVSLVLHLSLVVVISLKNIIGSNNVIEIPKSIRVDMIALPDKLPEDVSISEPATAKPKPVVVSPKIEKISEKKINLKESQKKALEKLNAMRALEKIEQEVQASNKTAGKLAKPMTHKGNIISSGNSFSGISRLRVNDYLEELTTRVRENWVLPQWLSGATLKAAIVITIDERGYVVKKEIQTSSGNKVFDSSCLAAVVNASPFAAPPAEVQDAQIMIRFPFE